VGQPTRNTSHLNSPPLLETHVLPVSTFMSPPTPGSLLEVWLPLRRASWDQKFGVTQLLLHWKARAPPFTQPSPPIPSIVFILSGGASAPAVAPAACQT